ncbi:TonB-dependent receptor plug domain-containing protein [Flavobacterium sp.]|uniref:TonB-dependent receptor plug domain-containing protein n=1 Tax=Flavobacterium sp. TaxID=239 RepID=UPI003526E336
MKRNYCLLLCIVSTFCWSQTNSVTQLKELVLTDVSLQLFSNKVTKIQLTDSVIANATSLTALLSNHTGIYCKENGRGMVASASFRGTTAQQTAVIWNGIAVNSSLTGQTDFNTINPSDFENITVRNGGGSVLYGSGAVGGSVHLNTDVAFKESLKNRFNLQYGSYSTARLQYNFLKATEKFIATFSVTRNQSENDYDYIGFNKKNENGKYENTSFTTVLGYKINDENQLKLFSYFYDGERFLSGTIAAPSKNKYNDFVTRNLLEWRNTSIGSILSTTKIAYLTEAYQYFENFEHSNYTFSKAETFLVRNNLLFKVNNRIKMNSIIEWNTTTAKGSNSSKNNRNIVSGSLLFSQQLSNKLNYEASIRTENTSVYKSPFLYHFSAKYNAFNEYAIRLSTSKNFRIPSFNDLYWEASGNPNLKPEISVQYEISHDFQFKKFNFTLTGFQNTLTDMLRWLPNASGLWIPENTNNVAIKGIETLAQYKASFNKLNYQLQAVYSYTKSEDATTKKQLIYVPYHKIVSSLALQYKRLSWVYQYTYNGEVYTSSDNKNKLPNYGISNLYFKWNLPLKWRSSIGFTIYNVENKPYQVVESRPMPGRNYMFNFNLNL